MSAAWVRFDWIFFWEVSTNASLRNCEDLYALFTDLFPELNRAIDSYEYAGDVSFVFASEEIEGHWSRFSE